MVADAMLTSGVLCKNSPRPDALIGGSGIGAGVTGSGSVIGSAGVTGSGGVIGNAGVNGAVAGGGTAGGVSPPPLPPPPPPQALNAAIATKHSAARQE